MNINSILKNEGIEIKNKLDTIQVNKIADIISNKICKSFPEHNLKVSDVFNVLSNLDMYIAKMPSDSSMAKYFYKNNSIYFSDMIDLDNLDTLVIHECIHALQEIKNSRGKLLRLGLYNLGSNKGQGLNEAAVQLMSAHSTDIQCDNVKYFNMIFSTPSPLFYPIETALINQIIYFTGSYPLFHSTLFSNNIFKNTFISKFNKKFYNDLEKNFDLLLHYEELISMYFSELEACTENNKTLNKIRKINDKIALLKSLILKLTLSTQNLIITNCFNAEFEAINDAKSLEEFRQRLYNFNNLLISTDSYNFFNSFYCDMMNKLDEKSELIKQYGVLNYLNDLQTDLLDLEHDKLSIKFIKKIFDKLKLIFEEALREKS